MRKSGFTLVEVIVVAVIMAIIGTTATMLYTGYIQSARERTVEGIAKVAAASANAYYRKTGVVPASVGVLKLPNLDSRYTIGINDDEDSIYALDDYGNRGAAKFLPE